MAPWPVLQCFFFRADAAPVLAVWHAFGGWWAATCSVTVFVISIQHACRAAVFDVFMGFRGSDGVSRVGSGQVRVTRLDP